MKKSLSLVEVLVAAGLFAVLSLSFYLLLRGTISVRRRLDEEAGFKRNIFVNLNRMEHDLRNTVSFVPLDSGFTGSSAALDFYSLGFNYGAGCPALYRLGYSFQGVDLIRTVSLPPDNVELRREKVAGSLAGLKFSYFNPVQNQWQEEWKDKSLFPAAVKVVLACEDTLRGRRYTLEKYIQLCR